MKKIKYILIYAILSISTVIAKDYYIYVAAESEDEVALIRFDGKTAHVEKRIPVGVWPLEIEGPVVAGTPAGGRRGAAVLVRAAYALLAGRARLSGPRRAVRLLPELRRLGQRRRRAGDRVGAAFAPDSLSGSGSRRPPRRHPAETAPRRDQPAGGAGGERVRGGARLVEPPGHGGLPSDVGRGPGADTGPSPFWTAALSLH